MLLESCVYFCVFVTVMDCYWSILTVWSNCQILVKGRFNWLNHSIFALETRQNFLVWEEIKAQLRYPRKSWHHLSWCHSLVCLHITSDYLILDTNYSALLYIKLYYKIYHESDFVFLLIKRRRLEEIQVTSSDSFVLRALK